MNIRSRKNEFLLNPLFGLSPVIIVSMVEPFFGLNIALHIGMLLSILVLARNYFHKEYSNQIIVIYYLFVFALYQYITSHIYIIPDGDIRELYIYHGIMIGSIGSTFLARNYLYKFFDKHFTGSAKHLENNLREFYFISKYLFVFMFLHVLVFFFSFKYTQLNDTHFHKYFDIVEVSLIFILVIYEIFRIHKIDKLLGLEDFLPIVNKDGIVIGKVARSISFTKSDYKEMHPVVRVHFIHNQSVFMFRGDGICSDGKWDCALNSHVLYGETMDKTLIRVGSCKYGIKDFKPHFLLKHVVEKELEKQYVLLYYTTQIESAQLVNQDEGYVKYWPLWQIEENLGKGVFSDAFEIEYEYLKNTVFIAEKFAKGNLK